MLILSFVLAAGAASPKELDGFPVRVEPSPYAASVVLADIDGDGKLEIVAATGETVTVLGASGTHLAGFPVRLKDPADKTRQSFVGGPAVCDLDGNGKPEIIVAGVDQRLYAVNGTAQMAPGFAVALGGKPRGGVSCVKASRGHDLLLTLDNGWLVRVAGSGGKPKELARLGEGAESGVAVADLDGDGASELVAGGGDARLHILDARGQARKGFPFKMSFRVSGTPAVGDVDDDGRADVVFGSQDFKIYALDRDGKTLAGFPLDTGYRIYGGAALADLDGDGALDVVVAGGDGKLHANNGKGRPIAGFPVALEGRIAASPVVADVDKDGAPEIAAVSQDGALHLLTAAGEPVKGFPARLGGKAEIAPAFGDLDGDGSPELVAQSPEGEIHVWRFEVRGKAEAALVPWPMAGRDATRGGRAYPNPGRFKEVALDKSAPTTVDVLSAKYRFFDLDGEKESGTQIRWYVDGKHQKELDNAKSVPAERTSKHQRWRFTLQEGANFTAYGERGVLTRIFSAPEVEIRNTPPGAPVIALSPDEAKTLTTSKLEVAVTTPSSDPDGDRIEYRYAWIKNGKPEDLKANVSSVGPERTRKREEWRVVVVPFDGEVEGASASALRVIKNTPPGTPKLSATPAEPRIDDIVQIGIAEPAPDDDLDPLTYRYQFWVNGAPLGLPATSGTIPVRTLRKHQKLRVLVTAHDDDQAGGKAEIELVVKNTPPPAPKLTIYPAAPRTDDDLAAGVAEQAADADGDAIVYRHAWSRAGQKVDLPPVVPRAETRRDEQWSLTVIPFDGEAEGQAVSAGATIGNTPPSTPLVALERHALFTDEPVEPRIVTPSVDADGDPIVLKYRWSHDGKPTQLPESLAAVPPAETRKGQRWKLELVPFDGKDHGAPATVAFTILNSPPTAPVLTASHAEATVRDTVRVQVATAGADKDGDALTYRYAWFRDGTLVERWEANKSELLPGEAKKGELWRVEVRSADGESESPPATATFRVVNHAPDPPRVQLLPAAPKSADDLRCQASSGGDADSDPLAFSYRWFVDGAALPVSAANALLPASLTREKQSILCEVVASDGTASSKAVRSAAVLVANTPPEAPAVAIVPVKPTTDDDLTCEVVVPAADADADPVVYRYEWTVDGSPWKPAGGEAPERVPARATSRGQSWRCTVWAKDGEVEGSGAAVQMEIENSPPSAPRVRMLPERPAAGATLRCEIAEPAKDADGDSVSYHYAWLKDGVPQSFAATSTEVPGRLVRPRDLWRCRVTAVDARSEGGSGESRDAAVVEK